MIYSFDIFDTLITRNIQTPQAIFKVMQEQLCDWIWLDDIVKQHFAQLRIEAEQEARIHAKAQNREEVSIYEIYEFLGILTRADQKQLQALMELEFTVEKNAAVPINDNIRKLKMLLYNGERVILISDMYWGEKRLRQILSSVDECFQTIPIYVSCDWGVTKVTGSLFEKIRSLNHYSYDEWKHIGDQRLGDCLIPRELGIKASLFHKPHQEELKGNSVNSIDPFFMGYLKNTDDTGEDALFQLGDLFSGIILFSYVRWILDICQKQQIEELYFIARDGYVLKKIADVIIDHQHWRVISHYIYGSREAWRAENQRTNIIEYFQETVDFTKRIAFVDTNGTGLSLNTVANAMGDIWNDSALAFFFSYHPEVQAPKFQVYTYCFTTGDLIERLSSATHGTTIGYKLVDGRMHPILEKEECAEELEEYIHGVMKFVNYMIGIQDETGDLPDCRRTVCTLIKRYGGLPHDTLLQFWEHLNHEKSDSNFQQEPPCVVRPIRTMFQKHKSKIVLYGAGKIGKAVYASLQEDPIFEVVAWTDIDDEQCREQQLPVVALSTAISVTSDFWIIGMGKEAFKSARFILLEKGMPENKIRNWSEFFLKV